MTYTEQLGSGEWLLHDYDASKGLPSGLAVKVTLASIEKVNYARNLVSSQTIPLNRLLGN